jgi:hypothetical protein
MLEAPMTVERVVDSAVRGRDHPLRARRDRTLGRTALKQIKNDALLGLGLSGA